MKDNPVLLTILGALALALVGGALFSLWLIGASAVTALAGVFVGAISLALVVAAAALPIRAFRKNDAQPVLEHHYHDGTKTVEKIHTIDGRAPAQNDIRLLQLPAANQAAAFPELLRASYRAGMLAAPGGETAATSSSELREIDPANPEDWSGELRP